MANEKKQATINDNLIMEVAFYHETKGLTVPTKDFGKVYERFAEFKRYIKNGEFTLEELENKVYSEFGIVTPISNDIIQVNQFLQALEDLSNPKKGESDVQESPDQTKE